MSVLVMISKLYLSVISRDLSAIRHMMYNFHVGKQMPFHRTKAAPFKNRQSQKAKYVFIFHTKL